MLNADNGVPNWPDVKYYFMGDPKRMEESGCEWVESDVWPPSNVKDSSGFSRKREGCRKINRWNQKTIHNRDDVLKISTTELMAPL